MTVNVALPNQTRTEEKLLPFILAELDLAARFPSLSQIVTDWADGLPPAQEPTLVSRCIDGAHQILEAFAKVLLRPENAFSPLYSRIPARKIRWDARTGDFAAPLKQTGTAHVQQTLRPLLTVLRQRTSPRPLIIG